MTRRDTRLASLRFRSAPRLSRRYDRLMLPCRPTYSPDRCTHAPAFFLLRAQRPASRIARLWTRVVSVCMEFSIIQSLVHILWISPWFPLVVFPAAVRLLRCSLWSRARKAGLLVSVLMCRSNSFLCQMFDKLALNLLQCRTCLSQILPSQWA